MAFINQAVTVLQTLVIALGAGLAVWGVVNLMEGYGNDNPGAKRAGRKRNFFLKRSQLLMSGIFMFLRLEEQRIPHPAH